MTDATYLTDKYPGQEVELWTMCIYDFFCRCKPELPVSTCILPPPEGAPWYTSRRQEAILRIDGDIYIEPAPCQFMYKLSQVFDRRLMGDRSRFTEKGDISGIDPDIVVILPERQGVLIIENKPYYGSTFGGNQGPSGAYVHFVRWLNAKGVPSQYLTMIPISWENGYGKVVQLCEDLGDNFGVLLLEDIFAAMGEHDFRYEAIKECWKNFSDKGCDYA